MILQQKGKSWIYVEMRQHPYTNMHLGELEYMQKGKEIEKWKWNLNKFKWNFTHVGFSKVSAIVLCVYSNWFISKAKENYMHSFLPI